MKKFSNPSSKNKNRANTILPLDPFVAFSYSHSDSRKTGSLATRKVLFAGALTDEYDQEALPWYRLAQ
jgi:hypothetical protein